MSEIKCNFSSGEYSYNMESNESKARENELLFRLYAYLSNKDKLVCSNNGYVASIKRRIKKASEQGIFSQDFNFFNLGKDNIDFLEKLKDELNNKDSKLYQIEESSRHTGRALINNHYIDFVEHFKKPNIFWLNVNKEDEYWQEFPFDTWKLGENDGNICYERRNFNKGDIAIFYQTPAGIIQHIGRVYDVDDDSACFEILCCYKDSIKLQDIRNINALATYPPPGRDVSKMQGDKELAGIELIVQCFDKCFDKGEIMTQDSKNISVDSKDSNNFDIPLNQILYGPPGTGKTYHTIDKALEILNLSEYKQGTLDTLKKYGITDSNPNDRKSQKAIFDIFTKNERDEQIGQIAFVTFHQSFSYEEFVEGIKPQGIKSNADNEDSIESSENTESQNIKTKEDSKDININLKTADSNTITYKVEPGIFKQICQRALQNMQIDNYKKIAQKEHAESVNLDFTKTLWRLYTIPGGDTSRDYFDKCVENNYVWAYSGYKAFGEQVASGDYIVIPIATHGRSHTIRGFGIIGDIIKNQDDKIYRSIKWLWIDKSGNGLSLDINFGRPTIQRAKGTNKTNVLNAISEILNTDSRESKSVLKPYILIIDEINRGNISKILGELITLIESSKRIGEDEELKVTLPYSNEPFGVPRNLYIIGTMNTADRSIALIDTALRRRFSFTEMMPDSKHLADIRLKDAQDLRLNELLDSMNNRIEFLLDREHTIGHAFFFEKAIYCSDGNYEWYEITLDSIKSIFQHKIIPLLQEYFYDDYAKINAVLNDNKMIEKIDSKVDKIFPKIAENARNELDLDDKTIYKIKKFDDEIWDNPATYTGIYE